MTKFFCPECHQWINSFDVIKPLSGGNYTHYADNQSHRVDVHEASFTKYSPSDWAVEVLERNAADLHHTDMLKEILNT
jgi:hypothetical protein